MYNIQCTVYNVHYTMYDVLFTVYNIQCTVYSVRCSVYNIQCTVYNVQYKIDCEYTVYSVRLQSTIYSVQSTVYYMLYKIHCRTLHIVNGISLTLAYKYQLNSYLIIFNTPVLLCNTTYDEVLVNIYLH